MYDDLEAHEHMICSMLQLKTVNEMLIEKKEKLVACTTEEDLLMSDDFAMQEITVLEPEGKDST